MKPDEADKVLATLAAAWPNMELSAPTVMAWYDHLRDVPADAGMVAAHRIIDTDKWFPPVARFREVASAARRALEHSAARERGLPEPPVTADDAARNLAQLRAIRQKFKGGA